MKVHPAIAALRSPDASQRRAMVDTADAMKKARGRALDAHGLQGLAEELERYGAWDSLVSCSNLNALMADPVLASASVAAFCKPLVSALRSNPLGEAPLPFQTAKGFTAVELIRSGKAVLKLAVYEPLDEGEPPTTALFADREVVELVIAGSAEGLVHQRLADGGLKTRPMEWNSGDGIFTLPLATSRQIVRVKRTLLILQLIREPETPRPACEIALDSGETVRTASGDKSASQALMALSVLGAMGAYGALGTMEAVALNRSEEPDVRWEAARQMLGLGPLRGMQLLDAIAARAVDPLTAPAERLRDQLFMAQPELASLAAEVC